MYREDYGVKQPVVIGIEWAVDEDVFVEIVVALSHVGGKKKYLQYQLGLVSNTASPNQVTF